MIDTATILSFDLFTKIRHAATILGKRLLYPDMTLKDYNQRSIPIFVFILVSSVIFVLIFC